MLMTATFARVKPYCMIELRLISYIKEVICSSSYYELVSRKDMNSFRKGGAVFLH